MRLDELFQQPGPSAGDHLLQAALDVITPMLAHKVPFVTVQRLIDLLRATNSGLDIDRALVVDLLDPTKVQAVSKIEGDRIYLTPPGEGDGEKSDEDDRQDNIDAVKAQAIDQAQKQVSKPAPAPVAPPPAPAPPPPPK